jgi:hypothetical protein
MTDEQSLNHHATSLRLKKVDGGWQFVIGGTDILLVPTAHAEDMARQILGLERAPKQEVLPPMAVPTAYPEYVYVRHVGWRIKGTES